MRSWSWLTKHGGVVRGDIREADKYKKGTLFTIQRPSLLYQIPSNHIKKNFCTTTQHNRLGARTFSHIFTMSSADDQYEQQNDVVGGDVPAGDAGDDDYKSRTGQSHIPVQSDNAPVEDPIDPATADSDETLGMSARFPYPSIISLLIYIQRKTTKRPLTKATLLVDAQGVRSPLEAIESLAMRRVCPDQRMEHQAPVRRCVTPHNNGVTGG